MYAHLWHCCPLGQKSAIHIFDTWSGYKIMKQNVPEGSDFMIFSVLASCLCTVLRFKPPHNTFVRYPEAHTKVFLQQKQGHHTQGDIQGSEWLIPVISTFFYQRL